MDSNSKLEIDFRRPLVCGILHILLSVASATVGIVAIAVHSHLGYTGAGIWCSICFCLAGTFGVTTWKYKTAMQMKLFMYISGAATIFALIFLGLTGSALSMDEHDDDYCNTAYWNWCMKAEALEVITIVTGLLELIVAVASFIMSCRSVGACAKKRPTSANVSPAPVQYITPTGTMGNQPGQVVFMMQPNGTLLPVDQRGRPQHNALPVVYMQPVCSNTSQGNGENLNNQQNKSNEAGMTAGRMDDGPPPYTRSEGAVGGFDQQSYSTKDCTKVDLSQF